MFVILQGYRSSTAHSVRYTIWVLWHTMQQYQSVEFSPTLAAIPGGIVLGSAHCRLVFAPWFVNMGELRHLGEGMKPHLT